MEEIRRSQWRRLGKLSIWLGQLAIACDRLRSLVVWVLIGREGSKFVETEEKKRPLRRKMSKLAVFCFVFSSSEYLLYSLPIMIVMSGNLLVNIWPNQYPCGYRELNTETIWNCPFPFPSFDIDQLRRTTGTSNNILWSQSKQGTL